MHKSRPIYLLLIVFLLFQGYQYVLAKAETSLHVRSSAEIIRLSKLQTIDRSHLDETAANIDLYSEDDEDDNENTDSRRKICNARCAALFSDGTQALLIDNLITLTQPDNRSVFSLHYKYIFQRTLRV